MGGQLAGPQGGDDQDGRERRKRRNGCAVVGARTRRISFHVLARGRWEPKLLAVAADTFPARALVLEAQTAVKPESDISIQSDTETSLRGMVP